MKKNLTIILTFLFILGLATGLVYWQKQRQASLSTFRSAIASAYDQARKLDPDARLATVQLSTQPDNPIFIEAQKQKLTDKTPRPGKDLIVISVSKAKTVIGLVDAASGKLTDSFALSRQQSEKSPVIPTISNLDIIHYGPEEVIAKIAQTKDFADFKKNSPTAQLDRMVLTNFNQSQTPSWQLAYNTKTQAGTSPTIIFLVSAKDLTIESVQSN